MSDEQHEWALGDGLPRSLMEGADGPERLLGILQITRRERKALLDSPRARRLTRLARSLRNRKHLLPGERDRVLLVELYSNVQFRRTLWEKTFASEATQDARDLGRMWPSPEHMLLSDFLDGDDSGPDAAQSLYTTLGEWPDLVERVESSMPWKNVATRAWSSVRTSLDHWSELPAEQRKLTAQHAFAVSTILNDRRLLSYAIDTAPELEKEFADLLGIDHVNEEPADTNKLVDSDVLEQWARHCSELAALVDRCAGPPPDTTAVADIALVVGELEAIEESVRLDTSGPSAEEFQAIVEDMLKEAAAKPGLEWLDEQHLREQVSVRWATAVPQWPGEKSAAEVKRVTTGFEKIMEAFLKANSEKQENENKLSHIRNQQPAGLVEIEEQRKLLNQHEEHARSIRDELHRMRMEILSILTPEAEEFDPKVNYVEQFAHRDRLQAIDDDTDAAPSAKARPVANNVEAEAELDEELQEAAANAAYVDSQENAETSPGGKEPKTRPVVEPTGDPTGSALSDISTTSIDDNDVEQTKCSDGNEFVPCADAEEEQGEFESLVVDCIARALQQCPQELAYATQLAKLAAQLELGLPARLAVLLETALMANYMVRPDGPISPRLLELCGAFPGTRELPGSDERDIATLLALAGLLRPSLLALHTGALELLAQIRPSDRLDSVYEFAQLIREKTQKLQGARLDAAMLRGASSEANWEVERKQLDEDISQWQYQARHMRIKYSPAHSVWQQWQKPEGLIGRLIRLAANSKDSNTEDEQLATDIEDRTRFTDLVNDTDRNEVGRKRGPKIHARALDQLHNHSRQAARLVRRHISLAKSKPERGDYLTDALAALRMEIPTGAQAAIEQLNQAASDASPMLAGAIATAVNAIQQYCSLFDPDSVGEEREMAPPEVLASGLFLHTEIRISEDGTPDGVPKEVLDILVQEPIHPNMPEAFVARLDAGNLRTAEHMMNWIDYVEAGDGDELRKQLDRARERKTSTLRAIMDEVRVKVEAALALGYLSDMERARHDAELVNIGGRLDRGEVQDFDVEQNTLDAIKTELLEGLKEQRTKARDDLRNLDLPEDDEARRGISLAIEQDDIVTANELIERARNDETPSDDDRRNVFEEFFPDRMRSIERVLKSERNPRNIVTRMRQGENIGDLEFSLVPDAQLKAAREMLDAWLTLKRPGRFNSSGEKNLRTIFTAFGFTVRGTSLKQSDKNVAEVELTTEIVSDRARCPVPTYGSDARGRYRIVLLWGRPTEENLLEYGDPRGGGSPTIALYFGHLSEAQRQGLASLSRARARTLLVIDELLVIFLCGEHGSRMRPMFACALPFTYIQPYVTTAGLVPSEMFYGREQERRAVADPNRSCFLYGGRQLGKTALLRAVERDTHRPNEGHYALWMDLKGEGIGYDREPRDIWPAIWRALVKLEAIPVETKEPNPNNQRLLANFITLLQNRFARDSGKSLLLLLDESDRFLEVDSREVREGNSTTGYLESTRLKALMDGTQRSIKIVFAGLHNVLRTVNYSNHPLGHFGQPIQIGPLLADGAWRSAEALVREPLLSAGYSFEQPSFVTRVMAQTNYYPSLIQLYGTALINTMVRSRTGGGAPLYPLNEDVLEETYQSRNLREMIRSRFQLTLQLDPRYEVIAYTIAHECMDRPEVLAPGIDRRSIEENAREWWPAGFDDLKPNTDQFRALLDEMEGLGVLRSVGGDRYTLRNPNVLLLMGTMDEIVDNILQEREPPQEFEPEQFRARDPGQQEGSDRSPLTNQQEALIRVERNGIVVVCGLRASGLGEVAHFLKARGTENSFFLLKDIANREQFGEELKRREKKRLQGTTIVVVPLETPWSEEWITLAQSHLSKLNARSRHLRVVFLCDAPRLWSMLPNVKTLDERRPEVRYFEKPRLEWMSLRPWRKGFLRHWLEDVGLGNSPKTRSAVFEATGGWPIKIEKLYEITRKNEDPEQALSMLNSEFLSSEKRQTWLEAFGLESGLARRALSSLAQIERAPFTELIEFAVDDSIDEATLRATLSWAEMLNLVHQPKADVWQIDDCVAKLINNANEADE